MLAASTHSRACLIVEEVKAQMDRVRYLSFHPMYTALSIDRHEGLVALIAARDPAAAEAVVRRHLREIIRSLAGLAAERPKIFGGDGTPRTKRRNFYATA